MPVRGERGDLGVVGDRAVVAGVHLAAELKAVGRVPQVQVPPPVGQQGRGGPVGGGQGVGLGSAGQLPGDDGGVAVAGVEGVPESPSGEDLGRLGLDRLRGRAAGPSGPGRAAGWAAGRREGRPGRGRACGRGTRPPPWPRTCGYGRSSPSTGPRRRAGTACRPARRNRSRGPAPGPGRSRRRPGVGASALTSTVRSRKRLDRSRPS